MAKKTVNLNDSPLKEPVELLVTACALTNSNALVVGAPGSGKTALMKWSMVKMLGGDIDSLKVLELSESTREEHISGSPNPLYKLTPNAKEEGIEAWIVDETLLDPKFKMALADEMTRASTAANSALIHRMHSESNGHKIPVLATANWLKVEERTAPLFDRFASVIFVEDDGVDVDQFFNNAQPRYWDYSVPDWETVLDIRKHLDAYMRLADKSKHPSTPAIKALIDAIINGVRSSNSLDNGVTLKANYRRLEDIMKITFATGVYYSGDPQFTELHPKVFDTIALCYPATDIDEQRAWQAITSSIGDSEGSAIETYMAEAYTIANKIKEDGGTPEEILRALASHVDGVRDSLKQDFGNTQAVKDAVRKLTKYTTDLYSKKTKL